MSNRPDWLIQAAQRAAENAREAQSNPAIRANLQRRDESFARILQDAQAIQPDRLPAPRTAPRPSRHAARPSRSRMAYRPHTLEECRDDALAREYVWKGIERTAPPKVQREFAL